MEIITKSTIAAASAIVERAIPPMTKLSVVPDTPLAKLMGEVFTETENHSVDLTQMVEDIQLSRFGVLDSWDEFKEKHTSYIKKQLKSYNNTFIPMVKDLVEKIQENVSEQARQRASYETTIITLPNDWLDAYYDEVTTRLRALGMTLGTPLTNVIVDSSKYAYKTMYDDLHRLVGEELLLKYKVYYQQLHGGDLYLDVYNTLLKIGEVGKYPQPSFRNLYINIFLHNLFTEYLEHCPPGFKCNDWYNACLGILHALDIQIQATFELYQNATKTGLVFYHVDKDARRIWVYESTYQTMDWVNEVEMILGLFEQEYPLQFYTQKALRENAEKLTQAGEFYLQAYQAKDEEDKAHVIKLLVATEISKAIANIRNNEELAEDFEGLISKEVLEGNIYEKVRVFLNARYLLTTIVKESLYDVVSEALSNVVFAQTLFGHIVTKLKYYHEQNEVNSESDKDKLFAHTVISLVNQYLLDQLCLYHVPTVEG